MRWGFVETNQYIRFRDAMGKLEDMEKGMPGLAVVHGEAGFGKTRCAKKYASKNGAIYYYVQQDETALSMLQHVCEEFNRETARTIAGNKRILIEELDQNPRLLFVDEADKIPLNFLEHFRDLNELTGSSIVFIGETVIYRAIHSRKRIWSRIKESIAFHQIIEEDIAMFALRQCKLKTQPNAATSLKLKTRGDWRLFLVEMIDLAKMAETAESEWITLEMVKALPEREQNPENPNFGKPKKSKRTP